MMLLEERLRLAARASVDAIDVPDLPARVRALRLPAPRRRTRARWLPAAVAAVLLLAVGATDRGRVALAQAVAHTVEFFKLAPDGSHRAAGSVITFEDALAEKTFRVVPPSGLPANARLVEVRRIPEGDHGADATIVFQYAVDGRRFDVAEADSRKARSLTARRETMTYVVAPVVSLSTTPTHIVFITSDGDAISLAQMEDIRRATVAAALQAERKREAPR